jgi:1,4-alpha-glucan branching enzyme
MWSHPGKQLIFMGSEFGQEGEWADGRSLDWWLLDQPAHYGVHGLVKDLNRTYSSHPALWSLDHEPRGFEWIDANDAAGNTFSFLRRGVPDDDGAVPVLASITNFSGTPHHRYRLGLPHPGRWNEILNTDAESYGGSGVGNLGAVVAEEVPWHGQPYSALVTLPALAAVWLEPAERVVPARVEGEPSDASRALGTSGRTGATPAKSGGTSVSEGTPTSASRAGGTSASEGPGTAEGGVLPAAGSEADASAPPAPGSATPSGGTTEKE